jgi:hypothetical protein
MIKVQSRLKQLPAKIQMPGKEQSLAVFDKEKCGVKKLLRVRPQHSLPISFIDIVPSATTLHFEP